MLTAAVLFFPSQPSFPELTPKRPVSPVDMSWNIACPVLMHYGTADKLMVPGFEADLRRRFEQWGVDYDLQIYPGGGHAFAADHPAMYDKAADESSWAKTLAFLGQRMPAS